MDKFHEIAPALLTRRVRISVVGCGGTGSAFVAGLPLLQQALEALGHPGLSVDLIDGDKVSSSNCVRQPFHRGEIGYYKAVVLASRVNAFYGTSWSAHPMHLKGKSSILADSDIVVGCVDSRAARSHIHANVTREHARVCYWLDIGNNSASGQYLLGEPKREGGLPTVAVRYPEILDRRLDANDGPSCSAAEALERQEPFINQLLASSALAMLARLFRHGRINYCGGFANLETGRVTSIPIP